MNKLKNTNNISKVISISNHKGGVGKTTSVANIGAALNILKKKVLLIDLDAQSNLSQSFGLANQAKNIYGVIKEEYAACPIRILEGLDIIPATLDLSGAEIELNAESGREYILKEVLEHLKEQYDYIMIDTPPSLGLLTVNAFTFSDEIFVPLQAEFLALQGLTKLIEVIDKVKKRLNKDLSLGGVFVTQYDSRKILNKNVAESIQSHLKEKVFSTKIRDTVALAEASAQGIDIFRYNPKSYGSIDYMALAQEILKKHSNML